VSRPECVTCGPGASAHTSPGKISPWAHVGIATASARPTLSAECALHLTIHDRVARAPSFLSGVSSPTSHAPLGENKRVGQMCLCPRLFNPAQTDRERERESEIRSPPAASVSSWGAGHRWRAVFAGALISGAGYGADGA
jgi:hypothetical protein